MNLIKKYIFNYKLAVIIGILAIASGLANSNDADSMVVTGLVILLGVFSYRTAKRRLRENPSNMTTLIVVELISLAFIIFLVFMQTDYRINAINDPFSNIIIPAWVLISYLTLIVKSRH